MGLNLPPISKANMPRLTAGLSFCAKQGIKNVRTHLDLADCTGKAKDFTAAEEYAKIASSFGIQTALTCIAQVPNSLFWRTVLVDANAYPNEEKAHQYWERREEFFKQPMDWKTPLGVHEALWPALGEVFGTAAQIIGAERVILENEPGNTLDARRSQWYKYPAGYVSYEFKSYALQLATILEGRGATIVGPSMECDNLDTAYMQYTSGYGLHTLRCDELAVNWYATPTEGLKPVQWAEQVLHEYWQFHATLDTTKNLIVTELNAPGATYDHFEAARDVLGKEGVEFYWHAFDGPWGLF